MMRIGLFVWSLLVFLRASRGISICSSNIFVGENRKAVRFHTDSLKSLHADLRRFCAIHIISDEECARIREYHVLHCFKKNEENDRGDESVIDEMSNHDNTANKVESTRSGAVDYSQTYGPELSVTLFDKTHKLSMFVGETPSVALNRFCSMLRLSGMQCTQVQEAFSELCKSENMVFDSAVTRYQNDGIENAFEEHNYHKSEHDSNLNRNFQFEKESQGDQHPFLQLCEQYWNFIALAIIILYIAVEHM